MKSNESGTAHVILVSVLAIALVGALGFIFWQNIINKPSETADTAKTTTTSAVGSQVATETPVVVDYGEKGIEIDAIDQSNLAELKGAPSDFVSYVRQQLDEKAVIIKQNGDTSDECNRASITVNKIYKQSFAIGSFSGGCAGGAESIWAKSSGGWTEAAATQDTYYVCKDLQKYKVPTALVGDKCEVGDGTVEPQVYSQS